jgi:hypothetical protein
VIAQAITDLICGDATAGGGGPEIMVVVDLLSLLHGHHDGSICETGDGLAIPIDQVRDLCRQAGATITAAIRGHDGTTIAIGQHVQPDGAAAQHAGPSSDPHDSVTGDIAAAVAAAIQAATGDRLQMGRDIRLANREQRRALRAMYRSCAHPGCRTPFADCFIHHVTPWEHDGPTDLANLLPLCGRHHHQVHEGGWRLTIDPARTLTWCQPGGRLDSHTPFQPLDATTPLRAGATATPAGEGDGADDDKPDTDTGRSEATPDAATTINAWSRSRGARGSPPTDRGDEEPRLFDPTAA